MNTAELECLVQCALSRRHSVDDFKGVFAQNSVPNLNQFPCCFVVNSDPSHEPGTHWLAFYFISRVRCEFFDSYGMHPDYYHFPFLNDLIDCTYSTIQLQSPYSRVCGHYCAYFLLRRSESEVSLESIISNLSRKSNPDKFVFVSIHNLMPSRAIVSSHFRRTGCISQCCKSLKNKRF